MIKQNRLWLRNTEKTALLKWYFLHFLFFALNVQDFSLKYYYLCPNYSGFKKKMYTNNFGNAMFRKTLRLALNHVKRIDCCLHWSIK